MIKQTFFEVSLLEILCGPVLQHNGAFLAQRISNFLSDNPRVVLNTIEEVIVERQTLTVVFNTEIEVFLQTCSGMGALSIVSLNKKERLFLLLLSVADFKTLIDHYKNVLHTTINAGFEDGVNMENHPFLKYERRQLLLNVFCALKTEIKSKQDLNVESWGQDDWANGFVEMLMNSQRFDSHKWQLYLDSFLPGLKFAEKLQKHRSLNIENLLDKDGVKILNAIKSVCSFEKNWLLAWNVFIVFGIVVNFIFFVFKNMALSYPISYYFCWGVVNTFFASLGFSSFRNKIDQFLISKKYNKLLNLFDFKTSKQDLIKINAKNWFLKYVNYCINNNDFNLKGSNQFDIIERIKNKSLSWSQLDLLIVNRSFFRNSSKESFSQDSCLNFLLMQFEQKTLNSIEMPCGGKKNEELIDSKRNSGAVFIENLSSEEVEPQILDKATKPSKIRRL